MLLLRNLLCLVLVVVASPLTADPNPSQSTGRQPATANTGKRIRKVFGGKVQEVNARRRSFVMNGGASKKYPKIQVYYGPGTRWSGLPRPSRTPKVGDPVQVEVELRQGMEFDALSIQLFDPNERPHAARIQPR
ncbi:MAG: hypothetical protein FJX77_04755 [Armatimonadetes bacterium]|nr:hypothetical protein [Armatimonadota bacterium]